MIRTKKNSNRRSRAGVTRSCLACTTALVSSLRAVHAQPPPQPALPEAIEEIVVSAQRRDENLQDIPFSILALDTRALEELQVHGFLDYSKFLPSLSHTTVAPGEVQPYFRGVANGGDINHSGPQPSTAVYLDEQPVTTIEGSLDLHLYDVSRVEALAGPQGTLYGAGSQSGTLRVITNKPEFGTFAAGYGLEGNTVAHGEEGYVAEGFLNLPLGERLAVRMVGWSRRDPGYIDSVATTRRYPSSGGCIRNDPEGPADCILTTNHPKDDFNDYAVNGARGALRFALDEDWTVTASLAGQGSESDGVAGYDPTAGVYRSDPFYVFESTDQWTQAALTIEGRISAFDVVYAGTRLDRKTDDQGDYSDYSYFYDVAYGVGHYWVDDDFQPLANPSQWTIGHNRYERQTHELRVVSPGDRDLRLLAGLFYQDNEHDIEAQYRIDGLAWFFSVPEWPDALWLTRQLRQSEERALFGELSWDIDPQWTATVGMRWFENEDSNEGFFGNNENWSQKYGTARCFADGGFGGIPCTNLDASTRESDSVGRFNLSYRFDDERMAYVTWSEGFRPGGVNRNDGSSYEPDYLANYEVGWKTSWLDGTLRVNGAAFRQDWQEIQFAYTPPENQGLTVIRNVGEARVDGVELDSVWTPLAGLRFGAGFAWLDARLEESYAPVPGEPPIADEGDQLPVAPEYKGYLLGRYEFPLGSYTAHLQLSAMYQDSRYGYLDNAARKDLPSQTLIDISTGLAAEAWSVEAFVLNAGDSVHRAYNTYGCYPGVCTQQYFIPLRPRTIGLKLTQEF